MEVEAMRDENAEAIKVLSAQVYKVASRLISRATYDRTIPARIVAVVNPSTHQYRVRIQGDEFLVYSNSDINYAVNDNVWLTIPQNDFNDKFISGRRR